MGCVGAASGGRGGGAVLQRRLMARACEAVPGNQGVQDIPSSYSSPHVIRCIRSRQFDVTGTALI